MTTNAELFARRQAAIVRGVGNASPISAARALNSEIWDVEGKRYVDFGGGIAVVNTGHCHPRIVEAVRKQLECFTHTCFQVLMYEPYIELAERLNELAPISGPAKSVLFTTGAEATENAIKIARAATGRSGVIAFTGGFPWPHHHGDEHDRQGQSLQEGPRPVGSRSLACAFPVPQHDVTVEDSLKYLSFLFKADIDPSRVAAIIIEPVQGEGGFHTAPAELMRALRRICDEHGIILIADEVQTGFGRTGRMFAMEHYDISADMICVAKSLAGGFPLSGVIGRTPIMDAADPGGLGGTYAGNPLSCVAALAVLDIFKEEKLLDRSNAIGQRLKSGIEALQRRNDLLPIAAIRGPGAMVAFDIVKERGSDAPDAEATSRVTKRAFENGLVLLSCGTNANTIRILVPLTASDAIVDEGLGLLEKSLAA